MIYPKVLIGTITFDGKGYVLDRFIERVKEFTYPDFEFVVFDNSKDDKYYNKIKAMGINVIKAPYFEDTRKNICHSRNLLRKFFLESKAEYLFHLEQDVIPRRDVIEELMQWKKPIVGGWYYVNQGKAFKRACIFKGWIPIKDPGDLKGIGMALEPYTDHDMMAEERLMKVYLGSLGITLIHRDVFKNIKFWWAPEFTWHDDTTFFHDLEVYEIDFFIDTDLLCPHFQSDWALKKKNEQMIKNNMESDIYGKSYTRCVE